MTITAKIIADSKSPAGSRITTMQLRYPRFIHAEFMTHRVFSRNASSSRAIPVKRLIQDVIDDPVYPSHWGANQKGMQAHEELDEGGKALVGAQWEGARRQAIAYAGAMADAGAHKQIVNRILEPFSHINVLVTSTEWNNFFQLRDHPDAQPEIRELAIAMREALFGVAVPEVIGFCDWHLPYYSRYEKRPYHEAIKLSVARCARVSYLTLDTGRAPSFEEDMALYERLVRTNPPHLSPAEHQATPGYEKPYANFYGWRSHRYDLENS